MLRPREIKKEMRKKMLRLFFRLGVLFIPKYYFAFLPSSYGHTTVKAPYPIRTAKLSTVGPDQYYGRGLRGNLRCCMSFYFFQNLFLFPKTFAPARKSPRLRLFSSQSNALQSYLLGLLAKIKCSICSYQLNLWYVDKCRL